MGKGKKWNEANAAGEFLLAQIRSGRWSTFPNKKLYEGLTGEKQVFEHYTWGSVQRAWNKFVTLIKEQQDAVATGKVDCFFFIFLLIFVGKRTIRSCVFANRLLSGTNPLLLQLT